MTFVTTWPPQAIDIVKAGHIAQKSATEIAGLLAEIGVNKTRAAVLGWLHRNGFSTPAETLIANRAETAQERRELQWRGRAEQERMRLDKRRRLQILGELQGVAPNRAAVDLEVLAGLPTLAWGEHFEKHCKWPIGDPLDFDTFRMCGVERPEGKSYCTHHAALAYEPHQRRGGSVKFHKMRFGRAA